MAAIRERGGSWYLDWRDPTTGQRERRSLGRCTQRQAEVARKAKEVELATGTTARAPGRVPLFGTFADEYRQWYRAEYPSSADRLDGIVRRLLPAFQHLRLDHLSPRLVKDYRVRRMSDRPAPKPATVAKELKALKAMVARAVEWEILQSHPFGSLSAPDPRRSKVPGFYSPEQLAALYAASRPRRAGETDYAPVWRFMANTGLRRGEALKALATDVVGDGGRLVLQVESDPDEQGRGRTKSGRLRRIPVNAAAAETLQALGSPYLLPRVDPHSLTRAYARCARLAGLPGTVHWLRHTFCSSLVLAGVPLRVVQELAGHASITTTEQYAHVLALHFSAAVDRIAL